MKKLTLITSILILIMLHTNAGAYEDLIKPSDSNSLIKQITTPSLIESFTSGHAQISFRYRYEFVDSDGFDRDANASTLRTRLNYSTDNYKGMTFFVEFDNVSEVYGDNFNSGAGTSPTRTQYPVIADPSGTEVNQAWFNLNWSENNLKLGRQRILLDNQRFVGGVAWRQNEQTYDAATIDLNFAESRLLVSYIDNVNRIFGDDVAAGDNANNTVLANWSKLWNGQHELVLFYYDIDNQDVAAFSTETYGFSFDTFWQMENSLFSLDIDYAQQSDGSNNPVNYSANYFRLEAALEMPLVDLILGREILEGNSNLSGASFRTPLATLHAFNGWSDRFLATPANGLEDTYLGLIGSYKKYNWYLRYHDFKAESTKQEYGTEFDASISYKFTEHLSTRLKFAQFNSEGFSTDTQHIWLMLSLEF